MNKGLKIGIGVIVLALLGTSVYMYALKQSNNGEGDLMVNDAQNGVVENGGTNASGTPMGKVAASDKEDGEYFVQVEQVYENPEDTTLILQHVMYFEGEEARRTAERDMDCGEDPIETCLPTLKKGFYFQISGAEPFEAPLAKTASIKVWSELKGETKATIGDVKQKINFSQEVVFVIKIEDGQVVEMRQVNHV
jgi:hypothetical protein